MFVLSAVGILLISAATVGYISFANSRDAIAVLASEFRRELANRVVDHLRVFLEAPQNILRENAANLAEGILPTDDPGAISRHFLRQSLIHPSLSSLYFGNTSGGLAVGGHDGRREVLYTITTDGFVAGRFNKYRADPDGSRQGLIQSLPNYDARTRPWYRSAMASGDGVWGPIYILFTGDDMALPPSRAVRDTSGRLLGVVGADLFVAQLSRFLSDLHSRAPGQTFIMEADGSLVASSTGEPPFTRSQEGQPGHRLKATASSNRLTAEAASLVLTEDKRSGHSLRLDSAQGRHFVEVTPFHDPRGIAWTIATVVPEHHYMDAVEAGNRRSIWVIVASLAVMALAMGLLARRVLDPLNRLTTSVRAMTMGELSQTLHVDRDDEIGVLARSFNEMSASIRTHREELEALVEQQSRTKDELRRAQSVLEARVAERTADIRKLSLALEQSHNMVMITGLDGAIEYVNPRFTELTGYARHEVVGANPRLLQSGDTPPEVYAEMWATLMRGQEWRGELKDRCKNGTAFWASVLISPVKDDNGIITHFVAMHEDITERRRAEQQVLEAKEQAEIANRAKSELMANMSHELRTPLNAIIGFSETLMQEIFGPVGSDKNKEYIVDIHSSGRHLLELITDILDVSAIEAGKLVLQEESIQLPKALAAVARLIQHRANTERVGLSIQVPEVIPDLQADPRRFKQIVLNLLSNAVKFTPAGGHVTLAADLAPDGSIRISVADTGIGMSPDELAIAMTQFGQVESGLNRRHEGTGLRLPLTRGLVELHGGRMEVTSAKGVGTTVTILFPSRRSVTPV
ncbi:hypothetical protein A6A04_12995 [Paramagnetospirillum marisnigri]|uniref:histidine kinase n=1 Tax=Paramagnetospirillum marisnigri TaxID=1285242 RepID=A0A178MXK6_9PROT|nr:hypothetical protein A6A04_12995 [Paramagnetospirillum marisnigri]